MASAVNLIPLTVPTAGVPSLPPYNHDIDHNHLQTILSVHESIFSTASNLSNNTISISDATGSGSLVLNQSPVFSSSMNFLGTSTIDGSPISATATVVAAGYYAASTGTAALSNKTIVSGNFYNNSSSPTLIKSTTNNNNGNIVGGSVVNNNIIGSSAVSSGFDYNKNTIKNLAASAIGNQAISNTLISSPCFNIGGSVVFLGQNLTFSSTSPSALTFQNGFSGTGTQAYYSADYAYTLNVSSSIVDQTSAQTLSNKTYRNAGASAIQFINPNPTNTPYTDNYSNNIKYFGTNIYLGNTGFYEQGGIGVFTTGNPSEAIYFINNQSSRPTTAQYQTIFPNINNGMPLNLGAVYEFELFFSMSTGNLTATTGNQYTDSVMPLWIDTDFMEFSNASHTYLGLPVDYSLGNASVGGNPAGTSSNGNWLTLASLYTMIDVGPASPQTDVNKSLIWDNYNTASMKYVSACGYANSLWNNGKSSLPKKLTIVSYTKGGAFPESSAGNSWVWNGIRWPSIKDMDPSWFLYSESSSYNSASNPFDTNKTGQGFGPNGNKSFSTNTNQSGGNEIIYSPGQYGSAIIFYDKNNAYVGQSGSYKDRVGNIIPKGGGQGYAVASAINNTTWNGTYYPKGASFQIGVKDFIMANVFSGGPWGGGLQNWLSAASFAASANPPLVINGASYYDIPDGIEMDSMGNAGYITSTSWAGFHGASVIANGNPYPYMSSVAISLQQFYQARADQIAAVKNYNVGIPGMPASLVVFVNGMTDVGAISNNPSPSIMWAGGADYYMPENEWHGTTSYALSSLPDGGYNMTNYIAQNTAQPSNLYPNGGVINYPGSTSATIVQSNKMWASVSDAGNATVNNGLRIPWTEAILASGLLTAQVDTNNSIGTTAIFTKSLVSNYTETAGPAPIKDGTPPLYDWTATNYTRLYTVSPCPAPSVSINATGAAEYPYILDMYLSNIGVPVTTTFDTNTAFNPATLASYIYSRYFTKGAVVINTTGAAGTFTFNPSYYAPGASYYRPATGSYYNPSQSLTIPAYTGMVLINNFGLASSASTAVRFVGTALGLGAKLHYEIFTSQGTASSVLNSESVNYSTSSYAKLAIDQLPTNGGYVNVYIKGIIDNRSAVGSGGTIRPELYSYGMVPTILPGSFMKIVPML